MFKMFLTVGRSLIFMSNQHIKTFPWENYNKKIIQSPIRRNNVILTALYHGLGYQTL